MLSQFQPHICIWKMVSSFAINGLYNKLKCVVLKLKLNQNNG